MTLEELAVRNKHNIQRREHYAREKAAGSEWYRRKLAACGARYVPRERTPMSTISRLADERRVQP